MRTLGVYTSGPRLTTEASNLRGLVMFAYNLKDYQVEALFRYLQSVMTVSPSWRRRRAIDLEQGTSSGR